MRFTSLFCCCVGMKKNRSELFSFMKFNKTSFTISPIYSNSSKNNFFGLFTCVNKRNLFKNTLRKEKVDEHLPNDITQTAIINNDADEENTSENEPHDASEPIVDNTIEDNENITNTENISISENEYLSPDMSQSMMENVINEIYNNSTPSQSIIQLQKILERIDNNDSDNPSDDTTFDESSDDDGTKHPMVEIKIEPHVPHIEELTRRKSIITDEERRELEEDGYEVL